MARTNVIKRDTDEWIAKIDDHLLDPSIRDQSISGPVHDEGDLVQRYNEIVR